MTTDASAASTVVPAERPPGSRMAMGHGGAAPEESRLMAATTVPVSAPRRRGIDGSRVKTVARTDLKQLIGARDFWIPMFALGAIFFFIIPTVLLLAITRVQDASIVKQLSTTLEVLPTKAQNALRGDTGQSRAAFAMGVCL